MNNNELLFSSKELYTNAPSGWPILILISIVAIVILLLIPLIFAIGIYALLLIGVSIMNTEQAKMKKSYIDIYNNTISGVALSDQMFSTETITFELQYNEILRLDYQPSKVRIHYNGGSYLVQAFGVEEKVINIIKEQQSKHHSN